MPLMGPSSEGGNCGQLMKRGRDSPSWDLLIIVDGGLGRKDTMFCVQYTTLFACDEKSRFASDQQEQDCLNKALRGPDGTTLAISRKLASNDHASRGSQT